MTSFGQRVRAALDAHGPLCVGIDPHLGLLQEWGMDASAAGAREFGLRAVDAAAGAVGFVKPQVSFFERYGARGVAALEDIMTAARAAGLVVIADAKRGDIGSTMDAYAEAWLTRGSPLEADAVTAHPFLGVGSLTPAFARAEENGKGVFVLAATSNPESFATQRTRLGDGSSVAAQIVAEVSARSAERTPAGEWASLGFVIGATVNWTDAGLSPFSPDAPILAPGFGHQGARPEDLRRFGPHTASVIAAESRSILSAGPDRIGVAISRRAEEYRKIRG